MNLFIVRDFARTDSSEPSVQIWKKTEKKKHLVSRSLMAKYTITCYSFSAKGVGEGIIILALSILTGVGVQVLKISPWEIHFSGAGCHWANSYGTLYHMWFSTGTRTPCSIRIRPCFESRQCLYLFVFLFFTSQSTTFQLRRDGSSCVEQVLS